MFKYIFLIILSILIGSCQNKQQMSYKNVFQTSLGFKENEIGSNIPILESYPNRQGFTDEWLIDIPKISVFNNRIYIADSYNKRVGIFPMGEKNPDPLFTIPNKGEKYSFARPYEVFVDAFNNIYVLASIEDFESYEVQNYSNQTAAIDLYDEVQENLEQIPVENFYLYKFSSRGSFLYRMGLAGINSKPMPSPIKISGDSLGNIYMSFLSSILTEEKPYQVIYRYSNTGELNFEFNTRTINVSTNVNDINYQGNILSVNNYIHNEQLVVLTEFQPTTNTIGKPVPAIIDNIWSSINIYSILENDFIKEIFKNNIITESILGIDKNGNIYLQSYDEEAETMKIRVFDTIENKEYILFAPIHSSYYILYDYFIDPDGNIYSYLIDRNQKVILLNWNTDILK